MFNLLFLQRTRPTYNRVNNLVSFVVRNTITHQCSKLIIIVKSWHCLISTQTWTLYLFISIDRDRHRGREREKETESQCFNVRGHMYCSTPLAIHFTFTHIAEFIVWLIENEGGVIFSLRVGGEWRNFTFVINGRHAGGLTSLAQLFSQ